jgi:hypothetical protein
MTNPTTIRIALKAEAANLKHDGSKGAAEALMDFANKATPSELIRFRELIMSATDEMLLVQNAD